MSPRIIRIGVSAGLKLIKNRILHHLEKTTKKEVRVVHEWNECRPGGS